jgi:hypothetical protein
MDATALRSYDDLACSFANMTGTVDELDRVYLSDELALGANAPALFMQVSINVY